MFSDLTKVLSAMQRSINVCSVHTNELIKCDWAKDACYFLIGHIFSFKNLPLPLP